MIATARWERDDLALRLTYHHRDTLTVRRREAAGYVTAGHSALFRLAHPDAPDIDIINAGLTPVSAVLATVNGVPDTLVAVFALLLTPTTLGGLTAGATYRYAVDMTDSRGETTRVAGGAVYAAGRAG